MKLLNFSFIALTSIFPIHFAYANSMPADLEDLTKRWEAVEKMEVSKNLMSVEFTQFDPETDVFHLMENSYLEQRSGKKLSELRFANLTDNSRSSVMEALFPKGVKEPAFCESFAEPKAKVSKTCTAEEQAKKLDQARASNCRAKVKEMLGGILHADPDLIFGDFTYTDGSSHVIFYVESAFFENSYLKYVFKRS